jgi:heme/copper-type cytochrome/quinol oxidase subunit 2
MSTRYAGVVLAAAILAAGCNERPGPPPTAESEVAAAWGPAGAPAPTWRPGTTQPLDHLPAVRNPYAGNAAAAADGERLWNWYNCSGCHSAGAGGGMGPPLIDEQWIYGGDDARVFESIWNGRQAGMPAWAGLIPQDDVWKIVAFIREAPRQNAWPWNAGAEPSGGTVEPGTAAGVPAPASTARSSGETGEPLVVEITGRQFWWDIVYKGRQGADDARTANELHLPVGRPVRLVLRSGDQAHRFCASLVDDEVGVEPGRESRLDVQAAEPGITVGACTDFLDRPNMQMRILVVSQTPAQFEAWLAAQRLPAGEPPDAFAERGRTAFFERGCLVCHTIRGTAARGRVAPDLTHVASRRELANGVLPNRAGNLEAWIAGNETIKPGNLMPTFKELDGATLRALGRYLGSLR